MAGVLLGAYRYDPLLNEYVGDVTEENTTSGSSIDVRKPIHLTFESNNNFSEALKIEGDVSTNGNYIIDGTMDLSGDTSINGNLIVGQTVTAEHFITVSDKKLKENIKTFYADISKVNVYEYNLKNGHRKNYGVLAQELLHTQGFEHLVYNNKDNLSVDYIQFIPVLIKEIKTLKRQIKIFSITFSCLCIYCLT